MIETLNYRDPESLISDLRHGQMVLLLLDDSGGGVTGIVTIAAELCEASHITFMARQARGLICLGLTRERCDYLHLPLMVEGQGDTAPFTLSIEAAEGIETGISAKDRAHTVRVAVASQTSAADLVQPGHIFPVAAEEGGLLTRADRAEATTDLARLAGLFPAAVFTEVLDETGNMARGDALEQFAVRHELPVGRVSELIDHRLTTEGTIERVRQGMIQTSHGEFELTVYRELHHGSMHLALSRGSLQSDDTTMVRVHVTSALRDLVGTTLEGQATWRFDTSLAEIAASERGVLVLISRPETAEELLASVDRLLGLPATEHAPSQAGYASIGLGAQILNDLGVGKIELLGAPLKYNALAGFGLEVVNFVAPT
ncbi:3,4-dihydroxy-2-butanone-4-phosphate synthase [Luminiphilus sp.]|nr:bifunctional 3,4-dihydroxy-2-butanone-4-phosphate synthase/GTP cyclohydrolase II [Halieaceae bacterium]MDA8660111.1 3,4-dihydroxy-2-butanone-4-phosphate synthase [Luminiphilus sp.]